jgi:hypothetical protein
MGLWDSIKARLVKSEKTEVDYGLEKLIKKVEQVPIYFNNHDFKGGNFTDIAEAVKKIFANKDELKKSTEVNRIMGNRFIARDKIWEIDYLVNPVLKTIKEDISNEKDLQKAEKIAAEYHRVRNIKDDFEKRVHGWSVVGEKLIESEYHGASIDEEFKKNISELYRLEEKYSPYNNGSGLKALKKAIDKMEQEIQIHQAQEQDFVAEEPRQSDKKSLREYYKEVEREKEQESGRETREKTTFDREER